MKIWIFLTALIVVWIAAISAQAQIPPLGGTVREAAEALGRVCFSERDSMTEKADCAAINQRTWHEAARRGRSFLEELRNYSPLATGWCVDARGVDHPRCALWDERERQWWISGLTYDGHEPSGWEYMNEDRIRRGLSILVWQGRYERAWRRTIEESEDLLQMVFNTGRLPSGPCNDAPNHWGGGCNPDMTARSRTGICDPPPSNWVRLSCGDTVNDFYRVLRVVRRRSTGTIRASVARGGSRR